MAPPKDAVTAPPSAPLGASAPQPGTPGIDVGGIPAARDPAWGARVVIVGLAAIVVSLALAVIFFDSAKDVIAITGPAFAVVSGLVAAYFGIRAGSLASERVQGVAAQQAPPPMSEKQQAKHLAEKNGTSR